MHLEDEPLDIGYASEKVTVKERSGKEKSIGGQDGKTQVIITAPFIDEKFKDELIEIRKALPKGGTYEVNTSLIVANDEHADPLIDDIAFYVDHAGEFGDWYGVRLADGPCENELTKALFIISKDGALFYDDFVTNLHETFNLDTLIRKVNAAQICYTGKGCH
jgi:thiol peroxidase